MVARFCCAVSVLALLLAPILARGDDAPQPVPENGQCSVPADPQWTPQENFVWQHVCVGEVADFNTPDYGGNLDPKRPEGWPESRILRRAFLETILLSNKYRPSLTRRGVRIVGARLTNILDLENAQLGNEFDLIGSLLDKGANFNGLRSKYSIRLLGSKITDQLQMTGGHVGGQLDLGGSTITSQLHLEQLQIGEGLLMHQAQFGDIILNVHVGGQLDLRGSTITGGLQMIGGHVGGQLALGGSKITGPLHLQELQIGESLFMDNAQLGEVSLIDVHVGGQLNLTGSKVTGKMLVQGIQVYSTVHLTRRGRGPRAEFDQEVYFIFDRVGQNVELAGGSFHKDVTISGTQIDGELRLGRSDIGRATWSPNLMLTLRNTSVGAIQDLPNSWPDKLDLTGFTYRNLGGLSELDDPHLMINRPAEWFKGWLGKQASYAPAPYQQLASVLRQQGRPDTADEILYAGKQRERAQSSFPSNLELSASWLFIGYGYYKFYSAIWAAGFLVTGVLVLWLSGEGQRIRRDYDINPVAYCFDLLLPIIRLRDKHYQIDLNGCVRCWFYFHRIMGYVLTSFLIAGIAGLTK
jgi:hypothetical protein